MRKLVLAGYTALAATFASAGVMAQDSQGTQNSQRQAQTQQQTHSGPISDAQLEKVADAMNEVRSISGKYSAAFQEAADAQKAQEIQQQAQQEMVAAVAQEGFSIREYNAIVQRLQTDERLRNRLNDLTGE